MSRRTGVPGPKRPRGAGVPWAPLLAAPALFGSGQAHAASLGESLSQGWHAAAQRLGEFLPNLLVAVAILVGTWVVAKIASFLLSKALYGLLARGRFEADSDRRWLEMASVGGRLIFWILMLFGLVAFFWALHLEIVTKPISTLLQQLFAYLPQILGAGIILLAVWIVALVLRAAVTQLVRKSRLEQRFDARFPTDTERPSLLRGEVIGEVVYWTVLLVGVAAALNALRLDAIAGPLRGMLARVLDFLPNLLAAGVILLVGLFFARTLRRVAAQMLASAGVDRWAERAGISRALSGRSVSVVLALVLYILVLIPLLTVVVEVLGIDTLSAPAMAILERIAGAFPLLLAAGVTLGIAYALARIVAELAANLLAGIGFDALPHRLGLRSDPATGESRALSDAAGKVVLVALMLSAAMEASRLLGYSEVAQMVQVAIVFGAHVLLGLAIIGVGLYFGRLTADLVLSAMGEQQGRIVAAGARSGVVLLAIAMALPHMGVSDGLVIVVLAIPLLAAGVALAIAFGIGGRDLAAQQLRRWFDKSAPARSHTPDRGQR